MSIHSFYYFYKQNFYKKAAVIVASTAIALTNIQGAIAIYFKTPVLETWANLRALLLTVLL